ncbi:hypothetical protein B5807_02349 [Epicoccum nigrum]|uniref:Mid2 domain-containing protein n=1 Tax=Epicoccum nigrum TaxID=105696 RepID=A0A1Y2M8D8_EPING|nr:hypothetical protein B5807_02349 [Epicoccum nigrum]
MSKQLLLLVSLTSALWRLSMASPVDPTITPAAVLPRQMFDYDFIGWVLETSGTTSEWIASSCPTGYTHRMEGKYAGCCTTTAARCWTATACYEESGRAYRIFTDSDLSYESACTATKCSTILISESYNQKDPDPKTEIVCGFSGVNAVYYRDIPPSLTEQVSTSSTSSLPETSTNSSPGASSTTSIAPVQTTEPNSGSKAWIAGAVAGPVLGLTLIGAGVWLFLRRKKKATKPHIDSSQPPAGVGGYTDTKPQYQPAQHAYTRPAYNQAYPQQGDFSPPQVSPAPQYGFSPPNNATPSPSMGAYAHDAKYAVNREAEAAELGDSSTTAPGAAPTAQSHR